MALNLNLPASTFWGLGFQAGATIPSKCGTGDWIQSLVHPRQALCKLSCIPSSMLAVLTHLYRFMFTVCVWVLCLHIYLPTIGLPALEQPEENGGFPGTGVMMDVSCLPCECWELSPSTPQEQQVLPYLLGHFSSPRILKLIDIGRDTLKLIVRVSIRHNRVHFPFIFMLVRLFFMVKFGG